MRPFRSFSSRRSSTRGLAYQCFTGLGIVGFADGVRAATADHRGEVKSRSGQQQAPRTVAAIERREITISAVSAMLPGSLTVPVDARGLVVFAHGSGSSRFSSRNSQVAGVLHESGLATLLFDLLTPAEEHDRRNVFDIALLADRLAAATRCVAVDPTLSSLAIAYFGASAGAAAALWAAAESTDIAAIVSRGGRPDLAGLRLADVRAPTLLIVGGLDEVVLGLNRDALEQLACEAELRVVEGATHLFEESGALEEVASLARAWFLRHLTPRPL